MSKLSIIIPSREERFLFPTIEDIFRNARGEIEVVAVLDSDHWPDNWAEIVKRHQPRLHTIHNGSPKGLRHSINVGVGSAISRGAKFVAKFDGHCGFSEGFDDVLKAECDEDWIVVPRRLRLDAENWTISEPDKPPHDYHYLSFPDDPNDFGGAGLNGKPWVERVKQRLDKPEYLIDEEMSSQGSGWFMHASYFERMGFMDEASYGPFWNEFQELGLCCWLSGGKVMVNKKCHYLHLHKGKKYGRGYKLDERWLKQGRNHTMLWPWNEAWSKQTLPFEWLIDHFWPVPTWGENWREVLYRDRKPRLIPVGPPEALSGSVKADDYFSEGLQIFSAWYGVSEQEKIDVTERVRELIINNCLDIRIDNATLTPGKNPFRGKKKHLSVEYRLDNGDPVQVQREEKEMLIIGSPQKTSVVVDERVYDIALGPAEVKEVMVQPMTPAALNDYLIRKFNISSYRLRAPMPIELPQFHRNDLAKLFAELGFQRGCEVGVAEGKFSEVLLQANPNCELLLVDTWEPYPGNPQSKTKEKHDYAYSETKRRTADYSNARLLKNTSMAVAGGLQDESLDYVYIDACHSFDYAMQDLIEWSKKVRSAGIVSGDDYYTLDEKRWSEGGVIEAVQAYTKAHRIPIWFTFFGYKSWDFMWVRP